MRQQAYALHFRGQASPAGTDAHGLRITSSGTSATFETKVTAWGIQSALHASDGDLVFFEADVRLSATESFDGQATLTFGEEGEHCLHLKAAGAGHFAPAAEPGLMAGAVTWRVDSAEGALAGATGFISSSFTLSESGELNDYHCGILFLPEAG